MRRTFGLIAVLVPLLGAPVAAALGQCPAGGAAPAFTVDLREPPAAYKSTAASALAAQAHANGTPLGRGGAVLGLTVNRYDLGISIAVESVRAGGGYCTSLRSARITLAAQPEVLVDDRYAPGSCQRGAIVDHEDEHVAAFRAAIARAAPAIDAALRARALPAVVQVATPAEAEEIYARAIDAAAEPVLDAVRRVAAEENGRIDTPAHYAEVARRCARW